MALGFDPLGRLLHELSRATRVGRHRQARAHERTSARARARALSVRRQGRVVPYVLNLLDSLKDANIFKSKELKLERFIKLFRLHPVVPLYGDMQIDLEAVLRRAPNFDERALQSSSQSRTANEYLLQHTLAADAAAHNAYLARHASLLNEIRAAQRATSPHTSAPHSQRVILLRVVVGLRLVALPQKLRRALVERKVVVQARLHVLQVVEQRKQVEHLNHAPLERL